MTISRNDKQMAEQPCTFNGLAEGSNLTIGDYEVTVTYTGGDGNDVELQNAAPLAVSLALFEAEADNDSLLISSARQWARSDVRMARL